MKISDKKYQVFMHNVRNQTPVLERRIGLFCHIQNVKSRLSALYFRIREQ